LLARTPVIEWIGEKTRFAAYRKLTGTAFDRERYASATEFQREALASSLARFLAAMHDSMDEVEEAELDVPVLDHEPTLELVVKEMRWLPASHWKHAEGLIGQFATMWVGDNVPGPKVLLHNDFHPGNMVFAEPVGEMTGIWDFSCVQIGAPTFDFRYFDGAPRDLLERMAGHYQMLTQRQIHVRAAVVANRMENLFDVLETRRMDLFDAATARWAAADAGL
jgi:aminoglycoside phosphotransferase (APT) family kinase protein